MQSFVCPPPIWGKFYSALTTLCCVLLFFNPFVTLAQNCVPLGTPQADIITLPTNVTISSIHPQGVTFSDKVILINGTVVFNRNVGMVRCTVIMGANASIKVQSSGGFSTILSVVTGCGAMWNSIDVQSGAKVLHYYSTFMNGTRAIEFRSGFLSANTQIVGCNFVNNWIGIQIGNKTSARTFFSLFRFSGNTFTSDGLPMLQPIADRWATSGISISNADVFIGESGTNTYTNMLRGISIGNNSDVSIMNQSFSSMFIDNISLNWVGHGIYCTSSSLTVGTSTFFTNNAGCGIFAEFPKGISIKGSTFTDNVDYGIRTINTGNFPGGQYTYAENNFNLGRVFPAATENGAIYHERAFAGSAAAAINNEIRNNTITVTGFKDQFATTTLIEVYAPHGGKNVFPIAQCSIFVYSNMKSCNGIWVRDNANGYSVKGNVLNYQNTAMLTNVSATLGIVMEGVNGDTDPLSLKNSVANNTIQSNFLPMLQGLEETASNVKCGFHIDQSPNLLICNNRSLDCYRGYHFSGDNQFCDFGLNEVGSALYGIIARAQPNAGVTRLGLEDFHENIWTGSYTFWGAQYDDPGFNPLIDRFRVDVTPTPGAPNHMPPTRSPTTWFVALPTTTSTTKCKSGGVPPRLGEFDEKEDAIIKGNQTTTAASDWDIARRLYKKLMANPDMRPQGSDAKAFYDAQANSSFGRYAQAEQQYQNAFGIPQALEATLFDYGHQVRVWTDSLAHLIQLEAVDTSSVDPVLQANIAGVLPQLAAAQGQRDLVATQASLIVQNALLQTNTVVNALPSGSVHESNLKVWLLISIKRNTEPGLDSTDYAALKVIADQCPNVGGAVVTKAPWMMRHQDMVIYQDETHWDYCDTKERQHQHVEKETPLQIIPNPAMDRAYLTTPIGFANGTWQLLDLNGRSLRQGAINVAPTTIDLSMLPDGMYLVRAQSPTGHTQTIKLVHQH